MQAAINDIYSEQKLDKSLLKQDGFMLTVWLDHVLLKLLSEANQIITIRYPATSIQLLISLILQ
jgi:hypothetical protein